MHKNGVYKINAVNFKKEKKKYADRWIESGNKNNYVWHSQSLNALRYSGLTLLDVNISHYDRNHFLNFFFFCKIRILGPGYHKQFYLNSFSWLKTIKISKFLRAGQCSRITRQKKMCKNIPYYWKKMLFSLFLKISNKINELQEQYDRFKMKM